MDVPKRVRVILVLIWNKYDDKEDWMNGLKKLYDNKEKEDVPQYWHGKWKDVFSVSKLFGKLNEEHFKNYDELPPFFCTVTVLSSAIVSFTW